MSVHQLLNPFVALDNLLGTATAPGGKLHFYERGTTTPKDTWQDFGKGSLNANPVVLDSAGRVPAQVWGDGDYSVKLDAADDSAIVAAVDFLDPAPSGSAIPDQSGNSGKFLSTDGVDAHWDDVLQLPDPTGEAGKMVVVNGAGDGYNLQSQPVPEDANVAITANSLTLDDGTKKMALRAGSATGTNVGGRNQTVSVTFATAFVVTPMFVVCTLKNPTALSSFGNQPSPRISSVSTTGFTVVWTMGELDDSQSGFNFNAAVQFDYLAIGEVA